MHEKRTDLTIASTYRSSMSDLMLTLGVVLLLVVPLAWPSLKGLFG
jgi:hypothetical protein